MNELMIWEAMRDINLALEQLCVRSKLYGCYTTNLCFASEVGKRFSRILP